MIKVGLACNFHVVMKGGDTLGYLNHGKEFVFQFIARRPTSEVSTHNYQKRGKTVIIEFDNHGIT